MKETIILGGGCFWCTESIFRNLKGIISVVPGYSGGTLQNPTYYQVCLGNTGHAEVIKIEFDPKIIPLEVILEIFLHTHNPTTRNRQGYDEGTQYRSLILYTAESQKDLIEESIRKFADSGNYREPVVTEVKKFEKFYQAEEEHINYYEKNSQAPYCQLIITPKLKKLKELFGKMIKEK